MSRVVKNPDFDSKVDEYTRLAELKYGPLKRINPNYKIPSKIQPWMSEIRSPDSIRERIEADKGIEVIVPVPEPILPLPKYKVRIRVFSGSPQNPGPIISNYKLSTNIPEVQRNDKENELTLTDGKGEILLMPYATHTLQWDGGSTGFLSSGLNRRHIANLIPMGGNFVITGEHKLDLFPESGYSLLDGVLEQHTLPYE